MPRHPKKTVTKPGARALPKAAAKAPAKPGARALPRPKAKAPAKPGARALPRAKAKAPAKPGARALPRASDLPKAPSKRFGTLAGSVRQAVGMQARAQRPTRAQPPASAFEEANAIEMQRRAAEFRAMNRAAATAETGVSFKGLSRARQHARNKPKPK